MSEEGHLFIVDGDLTSLACDAWMLPTDWSFSISESFRGAVVPPVAGRLQVRKWAANEYFRPYRPTRDPSTPWMWLGYVGRDSTVPTSFFAERAAGFIRHVGPMVKQSPSGGRARALLAVNLVGSGHGGKASERLALCHALVPELLQAARQTGVDVALVAWGREAYSAAQRARANLIDNADPARCSSTIWNLGSDFASLEREAEKLATAVRTDSLVLFMGAGVSKNAGVPDWKELLQSIASDAHFKPEELAAMAKHDFRDQAALLDRRMGPDKLRAAIKKHTTAAGYSLTHALLASLAVREAVTTNYDSLYEKAVGHRSGGVTVLPAERVEPGRPWLLKLHGSVDHDDDFVLTRDDYLAVTTRRGALLGLLQAMLLTRTMLFVGYSLSDEDFHSVMSDVRRVTGPRPVGTALSLKCDPLFQELWSPQLEVLQMGAEDISVPEAARSLQIFLDLVAAKAADLSSFLLAAGYGEEGILNDEETALRTALLALEQKLPPGSELPSVDRVRRLLASFGSRL